MNKYFLLLITLILFTCLICPKVSPSPPPVDDKFKNYKYRGVVKLTETAGVDRSLELVIVQTPPIDVGAVKIEYLVGLSSSKHGGVAYVRDVRVVKVEGDTLIEVPSQTGNVTFYENNTITFCIYFLANVSRNSHSTYYIFFGAEDPEGVEDPLKLYRTDLRFAETKTGGVSVENSFYNITVDASLGGWMVHLIHKAGSGTRYVHGDSGGGAFIYYTGRWLSQVFNTKMVDYKVLALGPIAVHIKFWGPLVDTSRKDVGVGSYETTWIFSAYSPAVIIVQKVTLKTVIKANDFRPIQFFIPSFNWYDFFVLQSDRTIYQGSVTKSVDRGGIGVDFNEAYWEVDISKKNPSDAVAVIPETPIFDLVKEHWYNIGCLDYVKNTRNPDTRTQVFGPDTYKTPVRFLLIVEKSERMLKEDFSLVYKYEKILKQPLIVEADIPSIKLKRKTYSIYCFKVVDIAGNPLPRLKIVSDEGRMNLTDTNGIVFLNLTLGKRVLEVFWGDLKVGSLFLVASPRAENLTIKVNMARIGKVIIGTNGTLVSPPFLSDEKLLVNMSAAPNTVVACKIIGLGRSPAFVKVNGIPCAEGYDYVYERDVLTVRATAGSDGGVRILVSFVPETAFPPYIVLLSVVAAYLAVILASFLLYVRRMR